MADLPSQFSPLRPSGEKGMTSFAELEKNGLVPFALGPVYVYAGVQEDIPRRFASEFDGKVMERNEIRNKVLTTLQDRLEVRGNTAHFDRPVLARCQDWNYILNIMDAVSYVYFKKWLLEQQFVNRAEKKFFVPRLYSAPILDPLILDVKGLAVPASLDVYALSGFKGVMKPKGNLANKAEAQAFVDFQILPPEEDVVVLGRQALNIVENS